MVCAFSHRDSWAWWRIWTRNRGEWATCVCSWLILWKQLIREGERFEIPSVLVSPPVEIVPLYFLGLGLNCVVIVCVSLFPNVYHLSLSLSLAARSFLPFAISVFPSRTSEEQLFSDLTKSNWQLLASDSSRGGKQLNVMYHHLWQNSVCVTTNVQITSDFKVQIVLVLFHFVALL